MRIEKERGNGIQGYICIQFGDAGQTSMAIAHRDPLAVLPSIQGSLLPIVHFYGCRIGNKSLLCLVKLASGPRGDQGGGRWRSIGVSFHKWLPQPPQFLDGANTCLKVRDLVSEETNQWNPLISGHVYPVHSEGHIAV